MSISTCESLLWESKAVCIHQSVYLTLEAWLALCPHLSCGSKKRADFSGFTFLFVVKWSGNFQAPYMWKQKPEINKI